MRVREKLFQKCPADLIDGICEIFHILISERHLQWRISTAICAIRRFTGIHAAPLKMNE